MLRITSRQRNTNCNSIEKIYFFVYLYIQNSIVFSISDRLELILLFWCNNRHLFEIDMKCSKVKTDDFPAFLLTLPLLLRGSSSSFMTETEFCICYIYARHSTLNKYLDPLKSQKLSNGYIRPQFWLCFPVFSSANFSFYLWYRSWITIWITTLVKAN